MPREDKYWFRAKRSGWGWGPPVTWQGWVVSIVWFGMVIGGAVRLLPMHPVSFAVFILVMGGILTLIGYVTGEPPGRRGGE
jgi:hypothetical protein